LARCPTGSGTAIDLAAVADELASRLIGIFSVRELIIGATARTSGDCERNQRNAAGAQNASQHAPALPTGRDKRHVASRDDETATVSTSVT
jgi:hypothetical protein